MLVETGTAVLEELAQRGWLAADQPPQPNTRTDARFHKMVSRQITGSMYRRDA
jgi:hypothetical protein